MSSSYVDVLTDLLLWHRKSGGGYLGRFWIWDPTSIFVVPECSSRS